MEQESPQVFFKAVLANTNQLTKVTATLSAKLQADTLALQQGKPLDNTFLATCLQFLAQQSPLPGLSFEAITLLRPALVQKFWDLPSELQDSVRSGLLNIAVAQYKDTKAMGALGQVVREIIELDSKVKDGFNQWVEPMGQLVKWTASEEPDVAEAGVEFFIYLFKETSFTVSNSELPLHRLANPLLSTLFQLFTNAAQKQNTNKICLRQKILYLVLQIVKSFSYYDGNDDSVIQECFGETVQLWASLITSILKGSVALHLGIKKYAIKILLVIYRDMSVLCRSRLKNTNAQAELVSAWQFSYRFIPCYLGVEVWCQKQYNKQKINNNQPIAYFDQDYDISLDPVQAIAYNVLQLLSVLSSSDLLSLTVKVSIYHLINALFHYYILSAHQYRTWTCNHLYFVGQPEHESIRGKILNILNDIIQKNGDYAIQALLLIAQKFLMNYPQAQTVETVAKIIQTMNIKDLIQNNKFEVSLKIQDILRFTTLSGCDAKTVLNVRGETWRKSEVALSILGRFSQDIIVFQSKQQGSFDIQNFVKGLMKQFQIQDFDASVCILKGQSLYCLTRFTEIISIRYKHLFPELVTSCSVCVGQAYPTAIRVAACKSLTIFFRKVQKHKLSLSASQVQSFQNNRIAEGVMTIQLGSQTNNYALESVIELIKCIGPQILTADMGPLYLLDNIHKNISHPNTLKLCFTFLEIACSDENSYDKMVLVCGEGSNEPIIPHFITDCLETYINIIKSDQKNYLKTLDIELIASVLKLTNIVLEKCPTKSQAKSRLVNITPLLTEIIKNNSNLQLHVAASICLKNLIRLCPQIIREKGYEKNIVQAIHSLLKVPLDKTFEGASVYVGNIILLSFEYLLQKPDPQILQQVVLKVFKSRTPSVIQSLVLVYSRMINAKTEATAPFAKGQWENKLKNIVDFLASFSIQNRMGLKIMVDKWLLQQSLFRGNLTKISTFMALSKMFLLRDKRVDNLLVIGFNPSHTNINNDVNAPLKILATLIRCLHNEMGGKGEDGDDEAPDFQLKDQPETVSINVGLQKFKQTEEQAQKNGGGLADRQNQQGSTCYMSAMLEFYDDGEECDETTEIDLQFLKDTSVNFNLSEYLTDFFLYLNNPESPPHQYFLQCLRQLLKEDLRTLQKYVKVNI